MTYVYHYTIRSLNGSTAGSGLYYSKSKIDNNEAYCNMLVEIQRYNSFKSIHDFTILNFTFLHVKDN